MLDTVRNRPVTDTANNPARARKSPERSTAIAPGSRSRRRRKMNTPASTSTAAMSSAWKMNQPMMLSASNFSVPTRETNTWYWSALLADALEVQQTERQRDRDERGEDATPEHQLVGQPPRPGTGGG